MHINLQKSTSTKQGVNMLIAQPELTVPWFEMTKPILIFHPVSEKKAFG